MVGGAVSVVLVSDSTCRKRSSVMSVATPPTSTIMTIKKEKIWTRDLMVSKFAEKGEAKLEMLINL